MPEPIETIEPMLRFFAFSLDGREEDDPTVLLLSAYSDLACEVVTTRERGPERTVALRKLLESRDAMLRTNAAP